MDELVLAAWSKIAVSFFYIHLMTYASKKKRWIRKSGEKVKNLKIKMELGTWIRNSGVSLNCAQSVKMIVLVQNLRFLSDEKMQKRPFEGVSESFKRQAHKMVKHT